MAAPPDQAGASKGCKCSLAGRYTRRSPETVTYDPEPGIVVPKAPPAAIEELPPDQKPEGDNVAWVPGYWAWDDERSDFLWVSGIWRDLPPGRQWVPGYWGKSAQGFQWTSGYWADAKVTEVQYLPEPPATVETGPNIAAPSADSTWLPGCWMWQRGRYAWRPGFWAAAQADWGWVPAHYVYAPRGYVFVDGYWDYSVGRRGVLFAPVYFKRTFIRSPGSPTRRRLRSTWACLPTTSSCGRSIHHYYFGDYYAANYQAAGFYPRIRTIPAAMATIRFLLTSDGSIGRTASGSSASPPTSKTAKITRMPGRPRTWAAQGALGAGRVRSNERSPVMAAPFAQFTRGRTVHCDSSPSTSQRDKSWLSRGKRCSDSASSGKVWKHRAVRSLAPQGFAPARASLPRSPIAAPDRARAGPRSAADARCTPQPNPRVEAKPRVNPGRAATAATCGEPASAGNAHRNQPPPTGPSGPPRNRNPVPSGRRRAGRNPRWHAAPPPQRGSTCRTTTNPRRTAGSQPWQPSHPCGPGHHNHVRWPCSGGRIQIHN